MDARETASLHIDSDRDSQEGTTYSLNSAATRYRYENGRTYSAYREFQYWGPNDLRMLNHENIVHHLCLLTMEDRLFLAPVENPQRVLDIGTGRGLWAVDMADKFPNAQITGVDISPQPERSQPLNVEFIQDDVLSPWVGYGDGEESYDLIHIRGLFGSVADWPALYAEIFRHLKPGGYIEQMEFSVHNRSDDGTLAPDAVLAKWSAYAKEAGERNGTTAEIAEQMFELIREAGFEDVTLKRYKWPIGTWSRDALHKKIGYWNVVNWEQGVEGWAMHLFTNVLGWTKERVDEWVKTVHEALKDRKQHVYHYAPLVYARKPERSV